MSDIHVLDHATIDKIAAGEVIEKPASVAKELVENAIDAGADAITVETKEGGTTFLRVTDNGSGIAGGQVDKAFLRHATSKIVKAEDLEQIATLGFRGEALASIAAVSMVEMVTKCADSLTGVRYVIEGGVEMAKEEVGAPDGTTMIVRNLFYNVPARKKFLKKPQTEGSYISDLMEHMALSHPEISFRFIQNGKVQFSTAGNGSLKEVVYRIFGKEMSENVKEVSFADDGIGVSVKGFIGVPGMNRANRNYEIFFINDRYVKSKLLSAALEEGFREYLMQHKFPVCILHIYFQPGMVDVNVHPTKMEVRITNGQAVYEYFAGQIHQVLSNREMLPHAVPGKAEYEKPKAVKRQDLPELFELNRMAKEHYASHPQYPQSAVKERAFSYDFTKPEQSQPQQTPQPQTDSQQAADQAYRSQQDSRRSADQAYRPQQDSPQTAGRAHHSQPAQESGHPAGGTAVSKEEQLSLFEEKIVSADARREYEIIGQIFKTYWLVAYRDQLLIIDQHAAHEKIKYERFMKQIEDNTMVSQNLIPPVVVTLKASEAELLQENLDTFTELGFTIEQFGGSEYTLRTVPMELYGARPDELLLDILEDIQNQNLAKHSETIRNRIATMACKAAVKGNQNLSLPEMEQLLDELMTLDNPYHCPHGRPTIITMSRSELEKKFKRIV